MSAFTTVLTVLIGIASLVLLAKNMWRKGNPSEHLPGIPLVEFDGDNSKERYIKYTDALVMKGYEQYTRKGEAFCIRDFMNPTRPRVFLPPKYIEEVKNAPQDKLSLPATLDSQTLHSVGGPKITEQIQISTRIDLNRHLHKLIEPMQTTCFEEAEKVLPKCSDWTSVVMYPNIMQLFSRMLAGVMVGPELSDSWPPVALKYIQCVGAAQAAMRKRYHPAFYWAAYYFDSEVLAFTAARREAAELVRPVLEARQADYAANREEAKKHDDFIEWIMENYRASNKEVTPDETVQNIFIVMFASMQGTSFVALQSLFSIIGTPGALAEIREEIDRVSETELHDGLWSRSSLGQLKLMDSFMKETLRVKPFTETTVHRVAMVPYTFQDGLKVPKRTTIAFPTYHFNTDADRDAVGADAAAFHGKRWIERRAEFNTSKFQFASTANDIFDWGSGVHACPGRFMADFTIKLILVCLIERYDMKLVDGSKARPAETRRFFSVEPDTSMPIMFKDLKA